MQTGNAADSGGVVQTARVLAAPAGNAYRLYLDESGDHSSSHAELIGKRYLGLSGVIFRRDAYLRFQGELEKLKQDHFAYDPDDPPILHREDIKERRRWFRVLQDADKRRAFDEALLKLIAGTDFKVVAVVIDKFEHREKTYRMVTHPYHYGLGALLERYCGWLNFIGARGDLMAESRGSREDRALRQAYTDFHASGFMYLPRDRARATLTSKEAKIKPKVLNIAGLQLADLLAHPLKRDVLVAYGRLPTCGSAFADEIVKVVEPKYNRQVYQNRISGYGRVFLD